MDGSDFDKEPERYYDWMLWKMRQEKKKMQCNFMPPSEMAKRIKALEKRVEELENANVPVSEQDNG